MDVAIDPQRDAQGRVFRVLLRFRGIPLPLTATLDDPDQATQAFDAECPSKLRALRLARGMTLADLARAAGTDEPSLQRWETKVHRPNLTNALALATALGVDVTALGLLE